MIHFKEVTKQYPAGNVVLDNLSFQIDDGKFVVITGSSGAGKTTLAKLLIREIEPTSGEIIIDGESLSSIKPKHLHALRKKVAVIFQDYKIILDKTVSENINFVLQITNFPKDKFEERISHLLDLVGIPDKKYLFPSQLSGGELQRAAIARAIAAEPTIIFADEPTGNLDPQTAQSIMELLKKINSTGTTVIVSTHNHDFVDMADIHLHLENGKIKPEDTPKKPIRKGKSKT